MAVRVPIVEVAHHADDFGVGRPHREPDAGDALACGQVSTHRLEAFVESTLAVQVQIEARQQRRKAIGVLDLRLRPVPQCQPEAIRAWVLLQLRNVKALGMDLFHRVYGVTDQSSSVSRLREVGTDLPTGVYLVRSQNTKRIAIV